MCIIHITILLDDPTHSVETNPSADGALHGLRTRLLCVVLLRGVVESCSRVAVGELLTCGEEVNMWQKGFGPCEVL